MPGMTEARGREESTNWHHPVELVEPLRALERRLPGRARSRRRLRLGARRSAFTTLLLGDDPLATIDGLEQALRDGAPGGSCCASGRIRGGDAACAFRDVERSDRLVQPATHVHVSPTARTRRCAARRRPTSCAASSTVRCRCTWIVISTCRRRGCRASATRATICRTPRTRCERTLLKELDQRANVERAADIVSRWVALDLPFAKLIDMLTVRDRARRPRLPQPAGARSRRESMPRVERNARRARAHPRRRRAQSRGALPDAPRRPTDRDHRAAPAPR